MHPARIIGIPCLVLVAACAGVKEAPPSVTAQSGPQLVDPSPAKRDQASAIAAAPPRSEAIQEAVASASPPAVPLRPVTAADEAMRAVDEAVTTAGKAIPPEPVATVTPPPSPSRNAVKVGPPPVKAAPSPAKAPAKVSATPAAIEQPRKNEASPPVAGKVEPPLDVAALKARLRDTNAIGLFTKLALKNQVDDLLQQFRAHYLSGQKPSVPELRQAYDMLVLKVLALLQDDDPPLARTISGSREAIWGILADPEKFKSAS